MIKASLQGPRLPFQQAHKYLMEPIWPYMGPLREYGFHLALYGYAGRVF